MPTPRQMIELELPAVVAFASRYMQPQLQLQMCGKGRGESLMRAVSLAANHTIEDEARITCSSSEHADDKGANWYYQIWIEGR